MSDIVALDRGGVGGFCAHSHHLRSKAPLNHNNRPRLIAKISIALHSNAMDLLITPDDPAFETEEVPFSPDKLPWSGEPFLTYHTRRQLQAIEECEALSSDALHAFMQT